MVKPRGGKEAPTPPPAAPPTYCLRLLPPSYAENPGYEASNTVEADGEANVPGIIQLRTVYITTLGTNGADCTRKPERLLPERARWAIPPMAGLCCVDHLTSINEQGCSPFESRLKPLFWRRRRDAPLRRGLGRQSGTANSLVTEREKAHKQVRSGSQRSSQPGCSVANF
ncbi:hypothetical protein NEUTE2DRAFT_128903 [Neurospora tetrasperma FGSC 2509]|nr:hypothetical protein NEUTE2DRAFT_128903 [Neurospora tetrasperma FGSC 2509]